MWRSQHIPGTWKMGAFVETNPLQKAKKWKFGSPVHSQ